MQSYSLKFSELPYVDESGQPKLFMNGSLTDLLKIGDVVRWHGLGSLKTLDANTLFFSSRFDIDEDSLRSEVQLAMLVAEKLDMRFLPEPKTRYAPPYNPYVHLTGRSGGEAMLIFWPEFTTNGKIERFGKARGYVAHPLNLHNSGKARAAVLTYPALSDFVKERLTGLSKDNDDIYWYQRGYDGRSDFDRQYQKDLDDEVAEIEAEMSADETLGEEGLVFDWASGIIQDPLRLAAMADTLRSIDWYARQACVGIHTGRAHNKVPFPQSAERCLIRCWQIGHGGVQRPDNLNFSDIESQSLHFVRARAHSILELTKEDRRNGNFAIARALLRASGLKAYEIGNSIRFGGTPDLSASYCEDCIPEMRLVSHAARIQLLDFFETGDKYKLLEAHARKCAEAGFVTPDWPWSITEFGRQVCKLQLSHQAKPLPSLFETAIFTPRKAIISGHIEESSSSPIDRARNSRWPTFPSGETVPVDFISCALLEVPGEDSGLLPSEMKLERRGDGLLVSISGRTVLEFELKVDGEGTLVDASSFILRRDILLRGENHLSARISPDSRGTKLHLLQRNNIIATSALERTNEENLFRVRGFQSVATEERPCNLEIACLVNWATLTRSSGFPKAGGVNLVDGMALVSGTTDPRLMAFLAKIDSVMRQRLMRRTPAVADDAQDVIDNFFESDIR